MTRSLRRGSCRWRTKQTRRRRRRRRLQQRRPSERRRRWSRPRSRSRRRTVQEDERAVDRAVRALARRDHSAASLRTKLERAGLSESAQSAALDVLQRGGYVDDSRFARDRAAVLADRGYGDAWIHADLERQGIYRETAETAVAAL